jgi:D-alanyl-D-alanine carboxypeptidase
MYLLLAALTAAVPAPTVVAATSPQQAAKVQHTLAQIAAVRFLEELNGSGSLEPFVSSSFSEVSLGREAAPERARQFEHLRALSGGFEVLEWLPRGERMIEVSALSRRGNRHAKFVLFTSSMEPGKIADIFILPERDPVRAAADAFPKGAVRHGELVRLVQRRIDALAEEGSFSGAILVARGDDILLREARGLAEQTWQIPNRADTRFNVASVSKMWTAVVVMKLVEQGKLSLDDKLDRWVPAYPHREAASKITLRQLLQHRGGIGAWDGRQIKAALTSSQLAATMTTAPGEADKGFGYSNAGYILLGAAAEAATRLTYQELVERFVFRPAGMQASGFWPVTAVVPNRATGYLHPPDDPLGFGQKLSNEQFLGYVGDASGGAYSTIDDMFAFHRALASGRLVEPVTLKSMIDTSVEFSGSPRPWRYGLGLRLEACAGVPTFGHGGGGANSGVSSATYSTLDGSWTVIVLGNTDPMPEQVAIDVCELVHQS